MIYVDPWPEIYQSVRKRIAEFASTKGSRFAAVFSPFMTCEEAYLLARYLKGQNRSIKLVLGPVPVVGEDDRYPKGKHGEQPAPDKTRFTIRAEKCPNRLGVSAVLKHFQGELLQLEDLLPASSHSIDGMYIVGGYPDPWVTPELDQQIGRLELLVVQDFVSSSLSDRADYVLAGGSFAERNGTVVNYSGLAQEIQAAIRSPGDARQDGRLLMELSERRGLFNAAVVRREMAGAIPAFAPLGNGEMDEYGLQLFKVDQNATAVTSGTR